MGLSQQGLQLLAAQMFHRFVGGPFSGYGKDGFAMFFEAWAMDGEILEERMDGGEAMVSGTCRVSSPAIGFLQVLEKSEDGLGVEASDRQRLAARMLGFYIADEELEGIAVAFDGVGTKCAVLAEVYLKEVLEMRGKIAGHDFLKTRFRARSAMSPQPAWNLRFPSRRSARVIVR